MKTTTILQYIPVGPVNAISRERLAQISGLSDRRIRKEIQLARDAGAIILNRQDGSGYFQVGEEDLDEIARQYRQDTSRALSILKRRKAMRQILKSAGRPV